MNRALLIHLALILACGCKQKVQQPLFTEMPMEHTGIDFSNTLTHTEEFNMYTYRNFYNGGGVGLGDINNDGLSDLFFCGNLVDNKLYLNRGDFKFEDITKRAGVASENIWSSGVSFADINGDGWLDIYVCKSGKPGGEKRHNELFINNGDLTFSEMAKEYGIADEGFSSHAAFFDYDKDGDLDCYLLNNSFRSVGGYDMRPGLRDIRDTLGGNKLYRNYSVENGRESGHPKFKDVSEESGIYGSAIGFGLGVSIGDIDKDGWQDIYVSNDFFERDYLYINNKDGTFNEDLINQMRAISMGSMGADMADLNNDGLPEIFVTEMLPRTEARYKTKMTFENWDKYQLAVQNGYHHQFTRNVLQLNNGNATFSEIGRFANLDATDWSWSALMADFDNDGFKDIYVSNGIYKDLLDQDYINYYANDPEIISAIRKKEKGSILKLIDKIPSEPLANFAFKGTGDLTFTDQTLNWGLNIPSFSNGSAYGDLDNDGDLDLVVNNCNMPVFVFRNESAQIHPSHRSLQILLIGDSTNRFALGAQVSLLTDDDRILYQELSPMRGFQSSTDYVMTFGVGQIDTIDQVVVKWPDGRQSTLTKVATKQRVTIKYDSSSPTSDLSPPPKPEPLFEEINLPIIYKHQENNFIDFDRDRLLFQMVSTDGPKVATGDINGDGLDDLYLGGASGQSGSLLVQTSEGGFISTNQNLFESDKTFEDVDAAFFDADSDGDLDLLVGSGGNDFSRKSSYLLDRLYLNEGDGKFTRSQRAFSDKILESTSCIRPCDFDKDGDVDLFIGTRLITSIYGIPADSYLWLNDGTGFFSNASHEICPDLEQLGMVTDATWGDLDHDGDDDLIVVGEFMPITVFINAPGQFENRTDKFGLNKTNGFWYDLEMADVDLDGHLDLVVGNLGLNSRLKATIEKPIHLFINDFDGNRTAEQILSIYWGEESFPLNFRDDLVMQLPSLKKKYLLYEDYKSEKVSDIFSEPSLKTAAKATAYQTQSSIFWGSANATFQHEALPLQAQYSNVHAILVDDISGDEKLDILMAGNFHRIKPEIGKNDAGYGLLLESLTNRKFKSLPASESGINLLGEIRDFGWIKHESDSKLIVMRNNDIPVFLVRNN